VRGPLRTRASRGNSRGRERIKEEKKCRSGESRITPSQGSEPLKWPSCASEQSFKDTGTTQGNLT